MNREPWLPLTKSSIFHLTSSNKVIKVEKGKSQIFTKFYPNFQKLDPKDNLEDVYVAKLGKIEDAHLVYRKEQFHHDNYLSSEYVLADYRFTRQEIIDAFVARGFKVISADYVQTGHWDKPLMATDMRAKEILIVAEK